jgi:hypothetical protein
LNELAPHGLKGLAYWENGWRAFTNNKRPVNKPDDLKGLKIRSTPNPYHIQAFKLLGMNPSPMPIAELYTALETGTFDAQEVDVDPHERLVHDVQPGLGQERMDVGHPAIGGVFHRQHAQIDRAGASHLDHIFKGLTGNRGEIRPRLGAGLMRIGSKFPLESDATRHFGRLP